MRGKRKLARFGSILGFSLAVLISMAGCSPSSDGGTELESPTSPSPESPSSPPPSAQSMPAPEESPTRTTPEPAPQASDSPGDTEAQEAAVAAVVAEEEYSSSINPDGLVLHLKMDDNSRTDEVLDSGPNNLPLRFSNIEGATQGGPGTQRRSREGIVGGALNFNGSTDYLLVDSWAVDDTLKEGQDFALSFWWKRRSENKENGKYVIWKRQFGSPQSGFFAVQGYNDNIQKPYLAIYMFNSSELRLAYAHENNADDRFHNYILQRKGETFEIYVDGKKVGSDQHEQNSADLRSDSPLEIGGHGVSFARGAMDEVLLYSRALTESEVRQLAQTRPVLHLAMDNIGADGMLADYSTNERHQKLLSFEKLANVGEAIVDGAIGSALKFDGENTAIGLGSVLMRDSMSENGDFAVSFWWRRDSGNTENGKYVVWNREEGSDSRGFFVVQGFNTNNERAYLSIQMYNTEELRLNHIHEDNSDGSFHHYLLQRRGDAFEVYQDAQLVASDVDEANGGDISHNTAFKIGRHNSAYASGAMDDFRIYDRALKIGDIQRLYGLGENAR